MRSGFRRSGLRLGLLGILATGVMLTLFVGSSAAVDPPAGCTTTAGLTTCVFAFTGADQSWVVPAGVTSATFDVFGAQGGSGNIYFGGAGGEATATVSVIPGDVLEILVGGQGGPIFGAPPGTGGFNGGGDGGAGGTATGAFAPDGATGGGGGGASDVRAGSCAHTSTCGLADRFIVGGGGGMVASGPLRAPVPGGGGSPSGDAASGGDTSGGGGGTQSAPGTGGAASLTPCFEGTQGPGSDGATGGGDGGAGGSGASTTSDGIVAGDGAGGGGGGYYGGGGGAGACPFAIGAGAGGGGSSYGAAGTTFTNATRSGNGLVTISFTTPPPPVLTPTDGSTHNATEGAAMNNATLGTFTDSNTAAVASDFTATVCWNDAGTPPPNNDCGSATVSGSNGSFTVTGSHTFPEEGSYTAATSVTGADGSVTLHMAASVTDAALSATGVKASMSSGKSQTKVVANFKDADPAGTTSDYSAMINWGDGTSTVGGLIAPNGMGGWSVTGSHKYAKPGAGYSVAVTIHDNGGAQTSTVSVIKVNK
jgi:Glycine rich protein